MKRIKIYDCLANELKEGDKVIFHFSLPSCRGCTICTVEYGKFYQDEDNYSFGWYLEDLDRDAFDFEICAQCGYIEKIEEVKE